MDKESKLLHIAEAQQGYFTSKQAVECGFSRPNFHRKILSGKWCKEEVWGIYRLANYPSTSRPELTLWTLWSADKQGDPQGIWSHETALDIHGLSEVASDKLHMSVPRSFRKSTEIPKNLCLHFVDEIPRSEIELRQGYRVTTPLRSLADVIQEGTTQPEQIERAILDLAIQKSLIKGLATIQEMEKLQKYTDSQEMRDIIARAIDEVWTRANVQLKDFGRIVEPYTIGLDIGGDFATAVLCRYKLQHFILTAAHVGRAFRKSKNVKMLLRFDNSRREYPAKSTKDFTVIEWDPELNEDDLNDVQGKQPKDLAVIIPSQEIVEILKNYKAFYKIPDEAPSFSVQDALVSLGGIEPTFPDGDMTCRQLNMGPFGFVASSYRQLPDVDYIVCPVSSHTYEMRNLRRKIISSFQGMSGSGLWKFKNDIPILVGIAIAEDPDGYDKVLGLRNVYFHGPHSILSALAILGETHEFKL